MDRSRRVALFLLAGVLSAAVPLTGCGSPAQAEPLDVTYYYLPG